MTGFVLQKLYKFSSKESTKLIIRGLKPLLSIVKETLLCKKWKKKPILVARGLVIPSNIILLNLFSK